MSEPADTDFNNMENQFYEECEALRKSEISEERIKALLSQWETFRDSYSSNSLRDADRCMEWLLVCTAQLVFNVNYSKKISSDSKKKLKCAIISCGNSMHDCVHRQKLLNGIGSIIENPWQTASFSNVVTGPKSKKDDASNKLWDTEGWVMLESRVDYLAKIGPKCIDRVCAVLHVLVEKGHEIYRKNGNKLITFHPYEFTYHKYIEYLQVYALLHFNNLVDTQIVDTWEPSILLEVVSGLVKKAADPNTNRLFPKLKLWKDAGNAGKFFAKKATWRSLKLPNSTLLKEFFSIWMEMSGFVDNGTDQSESESPIDEIIKEEISCTENLYQIADVTIKLMGETSLTRLKYVELFVLAMTKDLTVIEAMKRTQPDLKAKIKELEERLSIRYLDLTRFFKDYPKTAKDCLITAFSLYPCQKLFTFLFPSSLSDTENVDIAISEDSRTIPAEYDDIKEMELEDCDLKVEDDLDLGDGASDDLATLIHNPRYKGFLTLNSNEELKKVCLKLLDSKSVAVIENRTLDYVKVDFAKYKDLKSRYDPEDDGIEHGYRQEDKIKRRVLQLEKRNIIISGTLKKAKKIAIQRARKLPTYGSEGVRRKGRPPKSTLLGDGYHSVRSNNPNTREENRTIPNVSINQNPWAPRSAIGGFYTEFFHTCIRVNDPPYKERIYGRNFNHEAGLLKSVKQDFLQNGPTATELCQVPGSEANGNTMQQNASEDCGIGLQSQNTEATTSGDIRNNHSNILNSSGQSPNETNTQMSIEPNVDPFYVDPFGGPLRKVVYCYTEMSVPAFAERRQRSERERNLLNPHESNEQVPQAVKKDKKRRCNTASEEGVTVTVKKPRRLPSRRSINVQSLSDTEEPHEDVSASNKNDDGISLDQSHLENSSKEPGGDINLSMSISDVQTNGEGSKVPTEEETITELVPNPEAEPLRVDPEPVFAGPFQIMATATKKALPPDASVVPKAAMPEKEKLAIVKDSNTNLSNNKPVEYRPMQKPLKTYGNNGKRLRKLVIMSRSWPNADDKQLEAYKSAIPVVKADVDQNLSKLNLQCTSNQANIPVNSSDDSIDMQSTSSSLGADVSSCSNSDLAATILKIPEPSMLTATGNPLLEPSIVQDNVVIKNQSFSVNSSDKNDLKSNTKVVILPEHANNETILEEELSQSNNEGVGISASSVIEVLVCDSEPSNYAVQQVSSINTQVSTGAGNESSIENSAISTKCVPEADVIDASKNEETIELVCLDTELHDKASTKPSGEMNQHQNAVSNNDHVEGNLKLEELNKSTTLKESPSTPQKAKMPFNQLLHIASLRKKSPRDVPSSPILDLEGLNPLSKPISTKLVNSEVHLESTENPEDEAKVVTSEMPLSCSPTDHGALNCSILPPSNDSAAVSTPLVPSSSAFVVQAAEDQHETSGFSNVISPSIDNSSNNQSKFWEQGTDQICLSTNDQIVSGKTLPKDSVITPLLEKSVPDKLENPPSDNLEVSSTFVVRSDLFMADAKDVMCQLLDMVEQEENEIQSATEKSLPGNDSAQVLETETGAGYNCLEISEDEPSTSNKETTVKLIELAADTSSSKIPTTDDLCKKKSETKTQESQVAREKSHREEPEIICLDSESEDDRNDVSQDNTMESDDDVECNSEIAQFNSTLLPHDACPGEDNVAGEGENRGSSEIPRPLTPVEQLEKIINDKLRRKAKRPYDEEEDRIKVCMSVINHAKQNKIRLRSLVACCVSLEKIPMEKLSERVRNQLETPVKRSTRLKKKKKRIVDSLKNIWQDPNIEQEMEFESSDSNDSDCEVIEIKKINDPNRPLAMNMQPKTLRGMPQSRKRKFIDPPKQQTVPASKVLKICSTPSNDSGVSGGNVSDPDFDPPSGSSTEVEDEDFEPGANSTCQNFSLEVYPKINCNPLSPDEIVVDEQADPLAINDSDGRTFDQGDNGMTTEPECVVGLQVAAAENMSNLQPAFPKSQKGNDEIDLLIKETKGEDPDCQDVAKENFTQESIDSDCEIIEDEESSESVGKPSQITRRNETPRIISRSLPPSATNINLDKRLTRSSEHVYPRPTRLTTDKSQFYHCSSLSLDENSTIPDANANTEDTDYLDILTVNESTKEAESAECILSDDVLENMEEDEDLSGTDSLFILPDENIEDSCNNEESCDSNKSMEVNTIVSTDFPTTTSEIILSDYGEHDHFVDKLTDQQISHVTSDVENDKPINSPQIATIPDQGTCEALDAPSQEEIAAGPVVNQSVEVENEDEFNIASEDNDVVVLENDTQINSPPEEAILEQDTSEQTSLSSETDNVPDLVVDQLILSSEQDNVAEPLVDQVIFLPEEENVAQSELDLAVEPENEDRFSISSHDDNVVVLDMEISSSPINSPPKETIPEQDQDACEQLSLPFEQNNISELGVDLAVNEERLLASEDDVSVTVPDMTTTCESTRLELDQGEPGRNDGSTLTDVTSNNVEPVDQTSHEVITDFDTNDKHFVCDNESLHHNILEDPDSETETQSVVMSDKETHPNPYENELSKPVEKYYTFEVEEELSTSSDEFSETASDVGGTTSTAGNETTHEFSANESLKVASPLHVVDIIETESEEVSFPSHAFLAEGESSNQDKETCQESTEAEENTVDYDEDGMSTQEDLSSFPQTMNIVIDEAVSFVAEVDIDPIDSPVNSSINDDADQDQEWVSSMHMDIEEPSSPEIPELTPESEECSENCWDSDDEPPVIEKFENVIQF